MKKYSRTLLVFLITLYSNSIISQIGITNNNPNKNAALDLNNTNGTAQRGLLLPQVPLNSTDNAFPMSTHVAGMHVYNTVAAGSGATQITPGEYYNDGTQWLKVQTNGWALSGNGNTNITDHFIGTTDAADFATRTSNTERMRIKSDGKLLIGTSTVPTGGTNAKLIIDNGTTAGALQIKDGTQGANYIFTSDTNGVGTWKPQLTDLSFGTLSATGVNIPSTSTDWIYTTTSISLPPGKWLVTANILITKGGGLWTGSNESWWLFSSFSNSPTTLAVSTDIVNGVYISGLLPPNSEFNTLSGSTIIYNTTTANKTYYYIVKNFILNNATGQLFKFASNWGENNITWRAID